MAVFEALTGLPEAARGAVIAIGNFDGVHTGHRYLIDKAIDLARSMGTPSAALTFSPHPRQFFKPDADNFIMSTSERVAALAQLGIDHVFVQNFDSEIAQLRASAFVERVLVRQCRASHIVVGTDFSFGRGKEGGVDALAELGCRYGFGVTAVSPLCDEAGRPYSSTRIREAIGRGDDELVARLMGLRPCSSRSGRT